MCWLRLCRWKERNSWFGKCWVSVYSGGGLSRGVCYCLKWRKVWEWILRVLIFGGCR